MNSLVFKNKNEDFEKSYKYLIDKCKEYGLLNTTTKDLTQVLILLDDMRNYYIGKDIVINNFNEKIFKFIKNKIKQ